MPTALPDVHDDPLAELLSGGTPTAAASDRTALSDVKDDTPPAAAASPASADWNGELDHLDKASWWGSVPAAAQTAFRTGYEAKIKNLEKGYQEKYRSVADERKALDARKAELDRQAERAELLASVAGQDPAALRKVYDELAELRGVRDTYQAREQERLQASYGDIIANDAAVTLFASLLDSGVDEAAAAAFARQQHGLVKAQAPAAPTAQQPAQATPAAPTPGGPRSTSSVDAWQRASGQIGRGDDPPAQRGGEAWKPGMRLEDLLESASAAAHARHTRR